MSTQSKKKKQKKKLKAVAQSAVATRKLSTQSSPPLSRTDQKHPPDKPVRDPGNLSNNEIKDEVKQIDETIKKSTWVLPKDSSIFVKIAYVLKKALLKTAGMDNDRGNDDDDDNKKEKIDDKNNRDNRNNRDNSDKGSDTPETSAQNKRKPGNTGKDVKKLIAEYNQAARDLAEKMDKMPKVAKLPTNPKELSEADRQYGIDNINRDINKARYVPPGIAGFFLKIAYLLREALLKMDGQGTEEGKSYMKLLEEYKEAYANVKEYMDNAPDDDNDVENDDSGNDSGMTREEAENEVADIKNSLEKSSELPDSEARQYLESTLKDLQSRLETE
jgi:hypothetical protein